MQKQGRGTMTAKLHDIFTRVGVRRLEEGNYNPVNYFERIRIENSL